LSPTPKISKHYRARHLLYSETITPSAAHTIVYATAAWSEGCISGKIEVHSEQVEKQVDLVFQAF
jgi:hypothetical protein